MNLFYSMAMEDTMAATDEVMVDMDTVVTDGVMVDMADMDIIKFGCGCLESSRVFKRHDRWRRIERDKVLRSLEPHVKYIKSGQFIRMWGGWRFVLILLRKRQCKENSLQQFSSAREESNYWLDLWEVGVILHLIPSCMADERCGRIHFIWSHSSVCMKSLHLANQAVIMIRMHPSCY